MREHFVSNSIIRGVQNKGVNFVPEAFWFGHQNKIFRYQLILVYNFKITAINKYIFINLSFID